MERTVELSRHLIGWATAYKVKIHWCDGWRAAEAWPSLRSVVVPRLRVTGNSADAEADYLIGMHELGHVLDPHAASLELSGGTHSSLAKEGCAWAWAAAAAVPVSDEAWEQVLDASLLGRFRHYRLPGAAHRLPISEAPTGPISVPHDPPVGSVQH